ncbi:Hypothetical protein CINCED_3A009792 [Cinara cedri]|uniref:Uncharacterized protein n=1 Tax=Cinara cedri TaxID=506608 RepID=A0A5E4LZZ1_9HEMI|nr:Hypothetical protein CINCED_3A009792 [Cinara cedri]
MCAGFIWNVMMVAAPDDDDDGSLARLLSRFRGGFESFPRSLVGPSSSTGKRATEKKTFDLDFRSAKNRDLTVSPPSPPLQYVHTHTDGYEMRALENNQLES